MGLYSAARNNNKLFAVGLVRGKENVFDCHVSNLRVLFLPH